MNRLKISLGIVFLGSAVLAGNFMACGGSSSATGTAGTSGSAGTTGTAGTSGAGTTGAAGTSSNPAMKADGTCVPMAYHRPKATDPCMCQDTTPNVCPTIGCVDLKTDDDNCGTCGTKCGAQQSCAAGVCGPTPTVVTTITGCSGLTLALNNGTAVFVADEKAGTISKLNATGAPTAVIGTTTPEKGPTWLASNGANLFWYNKTNKTIRKAPAAGGTAVDVYVNNMAAGTAGSVAPATPDIGGFVVTDDGSKIYISIGYNIYSLPAATPTPTATPTLVATEDHGNPGALALNGTKNIFSPIANTVDVDAPVLRTDGMPSACGTPDPANTDNVIMTYCPRLGRSQGALLETFAAVVDGRAFWVANTTDLRSEVIGTEGMSYDSITSAPNPITAATIAGGWAYLASFDNQTEQSGMIQKIEAKVVLPTPAPLSMARGLAQPTSMVVDATKVYWSAADCTISTLPK